MKYVTRKVSYDDDGFWDFGPMINQLTADASDDYMPTGLLDKDGNELWRERDPIGFKLKR